MTRLKTPLLSFDAHGTVGEAVTYQSSTKRKFAREKPRLPYSRTLPQQYQRWLYEDYAYQWRQQTEVTKRAYSALGVRHHLTGYQYWMKVKLADLPDIVALWHCEPPHADYSRNAYDLTLLGVSDAGGLIGRAYHFDGINDLAYRITAPELDFTSGALTLDFFMRAEVFDAHRGIYQRGAVSARGLGMYVLKLSPTSFRLAFETYQAAAYQRTRSRELYGFFEDTWIHVALTRSGANAVFFINASNAGSLPTVHIDPLTSSDLITLGRWSTTYWKGWLDHFVVYNRVLDQAEITRHSERRFEI